MPTQEDIERLRDERGCVVYCPVCRRPASAGLVGPVASAGRVARHLLDTHPFYAALLVIQLAGQERALSGTEPDPFYPVGTEW